jgi:hypothetical protein
MASEPSTSFLDGRRDIKGERRLRLSPLVPGLRARFRGGGWLRDGVVRVGLVGGTASETLDALCEGGPWKRAGGGSRCELVGFRERSMGEQVEAAKFTYVCTEVCMRFGIRLSPTLMAPGVMPRLITDKGGAIYDISNKWGY